MFEDAKSKILELEVEYSATYTEEEVSEIMFLLNEVHYQLYTAEDMEKIRPHNRLVKKIKRARRQLNKLYAWQQKMEKAETHLDALHQKIQSSNKLFCMDLEFCEKSKIVTEVGVSIFYPKINKLDVYHFVVSETYDLRNGQFVPDNKDNFNYGLSQKLPLEIIKTIVGALVMDSDYLVGHAFENDKAFLRKCGYTEHTKVLDTQKYAPYFLEEDRQMGLVYLIESMLDEEPENLHNGGNDAYYTMQCLLKMSGLVKEPIC